MKYTILICLLNIFSLAALCQSLPVDKETGLITYTDVVKCDSANAKQLYKAAKIWVLNAYSVNEYVCPLYDDETETIMVAPEITTYQNGTDIKTGYIHYALTIECRNNRYKYTFTSFKHLRVPGTNLCDGGPLETETYVCPDLIMNKKNLWASIKEQTNGNVLALIADMKSSIPKVVIVKKSNW